jgi:predicted nucleotidyltransferase
LYHKITSKEESIMDPSKMLQDKRDEILRIAAAHGAQNVRVFGSVSRGEAGPKSDVDLLVKLEPGRSLLDLIAIKQDLEDLLGREVDVVTEDAVSAYIREQVLKEAVNL